MWFISKHHLITIFKMATQGDYLEKEASMDFTNFCERVMDKSAPTIFSTFESFQVPSSPITISVSFKHFPMQKEPKIFLRYTRGEEVLSVFDVLEHLSPLATELVLSRSRCEKYCQQYYRSFEAPLWKEHFDAQKPHQQVQTKARGLPYARTTK